MLPRCDGFGEVPPRVRAALVIRGRELCHPRLAEQEILTIARLLAEFGIEATIATEGKRPIRSRATILRADARLEDVVESEYAGLFLPCAGYGGRSARQEDSQELIDLIRRFNARKKAIAAQNSGVLALARAGILEGARFAIEDRFAHLAPRGCHQGAGVVRDGNIITSGACPLHAKPGCNAGDTAAMVGEFAAYIFTHQEIAGHHFSMR